MTYKAYNVPRSGLISNRFIEDLSLIYKLKPLLKLCTGLDKGLEPGHELKQYL